MNLSKNVLTGVGLGALIIVIGLGIAFYLLSAGVDDTIKGELKAIRDNEIPLAYSFVSADFQAKTPYDNFKSYINQYTALSNNESVSINSRDINNDYGVVKATLKSKDGVITPIEFTVVKEKGAWKIISMDLNVIKSGASSSENSSSSPSLAANTPANKPVAGSTPAAATPTTANPTSTAENKAANSTPVSTPASNTANSGSADQLALTNKYEDKKQYFSINFPDGWTYNSPRENEIQFVGKKGTDTEPLAITVEAIPSTKAGGSYSNVHTLIADLQKNLNELSTDTKVTDTGTLTVTHPNGDSFESRYFVATLTVNKIPFKTIEAVVERADGTGFYRYSYAAPIEMYPVYEDFAKDMFATLQMQPK